LMASGRVPKMAATFTGVASFESTKQSYCGAHPIGLYAGLHDDQARELMIPCAAPTAASSLPAKTTETRRHKETPKNTERFFAMSPAFW
jgi:hypothetical protein